MGRTHLSPALFGAIALLMLSFASGMTGLAETDWTPPPSLSEEALHELQTLAERHGDTIASMPTHPLSQSVFAEVVALVRRATGTEERVARAILCFEYPDSPLGLMALHQVTAEGDDEGKAICRAICRDLPDTRVAAMALDTLVRQGEEEGIALCDNALSDAPGTRMARFARVRKGDLLAARGLDREGAGCYLDALIEGDSPQRLPLKLTVLFERMEEPFWATLSRALEDTESPITPLWARMRAALLAPPTAEHGLANAVFGHLGQCNYEAACAGLEQLAEGFEQSTELAPDWLDLGVAQFLWPAEPPPDASWEGAKAFLLHRDKLADLSAAIMGKCREALWRLTPGEEAAYLHCIATRQLDRLEPGAALETYLSISQMAGAPAGLRVSSALAVARLHAEEFHDSEAAIAACTAFCRAWADGPAPSAVRMAGAEYAFRARDYSTAREQTSRLLAECPVSTEAPQARLVLANCLIHDGHTDAALKELRIVASGQPGHPMTSRALLLMGKTYMSRREFDEARDVFTELLAHDAISPEARRAERYLGAVSKMQPE